MIVVLDSTTAVDLDSEGAIYKELGHASLAVCKESGEESRNR